MVLIGAVQVRRVGLKAVNGAGPVFSKGGRLVSVPVAETGADVSPTVIRRPSASRLMDWMSDYPVFWREWKRIRWVPRVLGFLAAIIVLVGVYLWYGDAFRDRDVQIFSLEVLLLVLYAAATTTPGHSMAREKENNTLALLTLTALNPREILRQKLFAVLVRLLPWFGLLLFHLVFFTLRGVISPAALIRMLVIITGPLVFLLGVGMDFSVKSKTIRHATTKSQILAVLLWVPIPCCPMYLFDMFLIPVNPFWSVGFAFSDNNRHLSGSNFPRWDVLSDPGIYFLALIGVSLAYILLGVLFYKAAGWGLYHYTRKQNVT